MTRRFFNDFIRRTHPWRNIGYSELAELYASRMLRVVAFQMVGGFSSIFMYQLGYSLQFIAGFWFLYFVLRVILTPLAALQVARFGPKHGTLVSNVLQIIGTIALVFLPQLGVLALLLYAPFAGFSRTLYDISYLVDFSKIKHVEHAGKELSIMQIIEKTMIGLGPIVGGVIAYFFGPQALFVFGAFLLLLSAVPLFFSAEPVRLHQKITLKHFNWKVAWRPALANIGIGVDLSLSGIVWNLFLGLVIIGVTSSNTVYVQIGALGSVAILVSIASAYSYGKVIDKHRGVLLLKLSTVANTLLHILRPFVHLPINVVAVNALNEVVAAGYALPTLRGIFDTADGLPGYRIVYLSILEATSTIGDALVMLTLFLLAASLGEKEALGAAYFLMAPLTLLILFHAKAIYRRGILTKFIHRV